ncbi:MAG: molecular chaperone DnaJ [Thiothrix sp.]|nr:MAG: molecular chaperone DnaJ [Thiothrix sp.]
MKNPYLILGLSKPAKFGDLKDDQVQSSYLALVRQFPPDRHPQRFEEIRRAYEQLKTYKARVSHDLFDTTLPDRGDLVARLLPQGETLQRPALKQVQNILKLKNTS